MASLFKLFLFLIFFLPNLFLQAKDPATCSLYSIEQNDKTILINNLENRINLKIKLFFKEKGGFNLSDEDFDVSIRNHIEIGPIKTETGYHTGIWKLTDINFKFDSQEGDKFRSFLEGCEDPIEHYCHFGRNELSFQDATERDWRGKIISRKCIISGEEYGINMGIVNIAQQNYRLGNLVIFDPGEEIMSFPLDMEAHLSNDETDIP